MSESVYDVIVVGAGVEGSSTAWQLSRRGAKCLLLEQFHLPHTRGSSHGPTRIIRKAYPSKIYTQMMTYNFHAWKDIQKETGQTIFENFGYITIGDLSGKRLQNDMDAMDSTNASYKRLSPQQFREQFPILKYDGDVGAVHDLEGGILYADKCVQQLQNLFVKHGGVITDGQKVESILPGNTVSVVTTKKTYSCRSLVLCCGPWANKVIKPLQLQLPLKVQRINVCYFPEKVPGSFSIGKCVPFSDRMENSTIAPYDMFCLPSNEYPGQCKMVLEGGPESDPEKRDTETGQWAIDLLCKYTEKHLPGLVPEPSIVEPCYYTMTPDRDFISDRHPQYMTPDHDFILDRHPQWANIIIGAGFSGHGFKHGPAVGDILADLALGTEPKYDISRFSVGRFDQN